MQFPPDLAKFEANEMMTITLEGEITREIQLGDQPDYYQVELSAAAMRELAARLDRLPEVGGELRIRLGSRILVFGLIEESAFLADLRQDSTICIATDGVQMTSVARHLEALAAHDMDPMCPPHMHLDAWMTREGEGLSDVVLQRSS